MPRQPEPKTAARSKPALPMRRPCSSGLRRRALPLAVAALWSCAAAQAQLAVPAGTNLFGDDLVQMLPLLPLLPVHDGYSQTLIFQDGRQLRGEIVSLGKDEIVWRRPDASEPLRFARTQIRRIALVQEPAVSTPAWGEVGSQNAALSPALEAGGAAIRATVKLGGADWLYGKLSSLDGESFSLQVSPALSFPIPRAQMRWIYFDSHPAPTFGFFGNALDLDDWFDDLGRFHPSVENGILVQHRLGWFAHMTNSLSRFALFFEMRENTEQSLAMLFRHSGVGAFATSSEAVFMRFPYPHPVQEPPPPPRPWMSNDRTVQYRFFYDGSDRKLRVFRNGLRLSDQDNKPSNFGGQTAKDDDGVVRSITVQACGSSGNLATSFNDLEVVPWDGVLPDQGAY